MKPPIFILGCDRSGTTLLRLMLNKHSKIHIPNESDYLALILPDRLKYKACNKDNRVQMLLNDLYAIDRFAKWGLDRTILERKMNTSNGSLSELLAIPFVVIMDQHGKLRWGDKTPRNTMIAEFLHETFPDALFIHILRDGHAVAASLMKVSWFPKNIFRIADHWRTMTKHGNQAKEFLSTEKYLEVKYEDLVRNPEAILVNICEFLGEDFEPGMLEYFKDSQDQFNEMFRGDHALLKSPPTGAKVDAWRNDLGVTTIFLFESLAYYELKKFGYPIVFNEFLLKLARPACLLILTLRKSLHLFRK